MAIQGNLVGVDPGNTTGLVVADESGKIIEFGQFNLDEMVEFTSTYSSPVAMVVVEDWRLRKQRAKQQSGSTMQASQVIGMMRVFAVRKDAKFILQPVEDKDKGMALSGVKPSSNHAYSHHVDAYNHLYYRMHLMGLVMSKLEQERL